MVKRRRYRPFLWAGVLLTPGCSEEMGPERRETTRVTGVVREGLRPVGGGWIEFLPVEGTVGNLRSAPIRPDGTFEADGVAVGVNGIGLVHVSTRLPGMRRAFDTLSTSIRRTIPRGGSSEVTIDLLDEAARQNAERSSGEDR